MPSDNEQESHEHTKLLTQFAEMKTNHISTMKLKNWHTLTFKKLSDSWDIKLIHSSKSDLVGLNQTGKILYTQSWPAFVYKLSWVNKWINISEVTLHSINSKTIYNLNYWDLNTMVTDLRWVMQKRESWDMGININEAIQMIKGYEKWKIPESKKVNYEYYKQKYGEYLHEKSNLTYFTELLNNFN